MKQENTKKSKLWLWLVLGVVLLAVAGTVLAFVLGGGQEAAGGKADRADLYWNIDRQIYLEGSETGLTTRKPGEDGVFKVRFAHDGEIKEFVVADRKLINRIDFQDVMGLVFDADGVVIDIIDAEELAVRVGRVNYVRSVNGNVVKVNSSIAMNGMEFELEITDKTQIYDVRQGIEKPGQIVDVSALKSFANVYVFTNEDEEVTHIYLTAIEDDLEIYWRAEQMWDSANAKTSRVPDADGYYSIEFCHNGGLVTLRTSDEEIATAIDNKYRFNPYFCFAFDEMGNITEIRSSSAGTFGIMMFERGAVKSVENGEVTAKKEMVGDDGSTYTFTLPESCAIYDASLVARRDGVQGQAVDSVRPGDVITVWTDSDGVPVLCYISYRVMDLPVFYNLERFYNATDKVSTREPNEKGWYELKMVKVGTVGTVTVKTKDKSLVDYIDSQYGRVFVLRLDGDKIVQAYDSTAAYTLGDLSGGSVVNEYNGITASVMSWGKPENATSFVLSSACKVYDVSGVGEYGEETELRLGDITFAHRQFSGEVVAIFVSRRVVGGDKLYYNPYYQYDGVKKETTRVPDENGYYVFELFNQGKMVTVKTKDKEIANKIDDTSGDLTIALEVKNGIIRKAFDSSAAYSQKINSGWRIKKINDDGTVLLGAAGVYESTIKLAKDCKIWNVSYDVDSHLGEKTKLRVGDMVVPFADMYNEVQEILIRKRFVDSLAWKVDRKYDSTTGQTLRTPDADGYYKFEMAINGKIRTVKTQDLKIANSVEVQTGAMALRLSGDIIKSVLDVTWVTDTYSVIWNEWDITKVKGNEVTAQLNKPGYANTGDTDTRKLASNVKIYDFSPSAKQFGEVSKLKVGDRVRVHANDLGEPLWVMILSRDTRVKGSVGYCSHCDKEVRWHPWSGGAIDAVDCHYYLAGNMTLNTQTNIGNVDRDYEVVLDLNGKSLTVDGNRAFLVWRGDELTIVDSVGGGSISATGARESNGGLAMLTGEATLNLLAGTYSFISSDLNVRRGGVIYVTGNSTLNIDGATLKGGEMVGVDFATGGNIAIAGSDEIPGGVCNFYSGLITGGSVALANDYVEGKDQYAQGGNVHVGTNSTFNMYGGVVSAGSTKRVSDKQAAQGANLYSLRGQINIYGGEVIDGISQQHGGNIFLSTAGLLVKDALISNGQILNGYGSGLYCQNTCTVELQNSTVNGSVHCQRDATIKVSNSTLNGSLYMNFEGAGLIMDNANMTGKLQILGATTVAASGKTTVADITLDANVLMEVSGLTDGALLSVRKNGVFTTELQDPHAYKNFFVAANRRSNVEVQGKALAIVDKEISVEELSNVNEAAVQMTADNVFSAGGDVSDVTCPYCLESVTWKELPAVTGKGLGLSGHYYLPDDREANVGYYYTEGGNTCLHLNGHNIKTSSAFALSSTSGCELNVMGEGNVEGTGSNAGGTVYVGGTTRLFGGTYTATDKAYVVSLNAANANLYMFNGTTINGKEDATSAVVCAQPAKLYLYGGTINANNVNGFYLLAGETHLAGVTVNATGNKRGVLLPENSTAKVYQSAGSIYGATAGNVDVKAGSYILTGGTITEGRVYVSGTASFEISGAPKIERLDVAGGSKLTLGDLTGMTEPIPVIADGVFTTELEDAEAYKAYFVPADGKSKIEVQEKVLVFIPDIAPPENDNVYELAVQMTADNVFSAGGDVEDVTCPYCQQPATWKELPAVTGKGLGISGHYYLPDDREANVGYYYTEGGNACLHLNGHNIKTSSAHALSSTSGCELNVMGEGNVEGTGANAGGTVYVGGTTRLFGGTYTATNNFYVVSLNAANANLYMFNGTIINGKEGATSAVVCAQPAKLYLYGGTINANNVNGFYLTAGETHLAGVTVNATGDKRGVLLPENSTAKVYQSAGSIYGSTAGNVDVKAGSYTLTGGTITEGRVYVSGTASFAISGAPKVERLDVAGGSKLTLGDLTGMAEPIPVIADGVFTTELENPEAYKAYFVPADGKSKIEVQEKVLVFIPDIAPPDNNDVYEQAVQMTTDNVFSAGGDVEDVTCPYCQQPATWKELPAVTGKGLGISGHYYLPDDREANVGYYYTEDGNACLHLNGHNIKTSSAHALSSSGGYELNVMGEGNVEGTGSNAGGTVYVGGTTRLFGGTYTATNNFYVVSLNAADANLYMFNGTIINGKEGATSAVVCAQPAKLYLYGGTINANNVNGFYLTAGETHLAGVTVNARGNKRGVLLPENSTAKVYQSAGSIYGSTVGNVEINAGSYTLTGGTITEGRVYVSGTASFAISGAPKVELLNLTGGRKLSLGDLTGMTEAIPVIADGVFTTELEDAEAYKAYFVPADGKGKIEVQEKVLVFIPEAELPDDNDVYSLAVQMTTDNVFSAGGDVSDVTCPYCQESVTWKELPAVTGKGLGISGHYYLPEDREANVGYYYTEGGNACLHLNGHNIKTSSAHALSSSGGYELNVMGEGNVEGTGANAGGTVFVGGTTRLYGGTYTATNNFYVVSLNAADANLYMFNGTTINGKEGATSAVVCAQPANLYMNGGTINANNVNGFYLTAGETHLAGVTVDATGYKHGVLLPENSTASVYQSAGSIYGSTDGNVDVRAGSYTLTGGTITEGSVYVSGTASFAISGAPKVELLNLTGGSKLTLGDLTGMAEPIPVIADGVFTTELEDPEAYKAYFVPADGECRIEVQEKVLAVVANDVYSLAVQMTADNVFSAGGDVSDVTCPYCQESVTWKELPAVTGRGLGISGHYYLPDDREANVGYYYTEGGNACLHLNGHNIKTSSAHALSSSGGYELNVMGNGNVEGTGSNAGGTVYVGGTTRLFGGTYTATNNFYVVSLNAADANLYMFNGTTINGKEGATSAVVCANAAKLYLYGGTINANNVNGFYLLAGETHLAGVTVNARGNKRGVLLPENSTASVYQSAGSIYGSTVGNVEINAGSYTLTGGTITEGSVYVGGTASFAISGAPKVELLNLAEGRKLSLGDLTGMTEAIPVIADGVFTTELEDAEAYKAYFVPADGKGKIEVQEKALVFIPEAELPDDNDVYSLAVQMTADNVFSAGGDVEDVTCPYCQQPATWKELPAVTGRGLGISGHYYLPDDREANVGYYYTEDGNACLHLNGHNIKTSSAHALSSNGGYELNVMGNGNVEGAGANAGGTVFVGGTTRLYGGTYTATNNFYVVSLNAADANLYMFNGTTINGKEGATSAVVCAQPANLYMNGGTINVNNGTGFYLLNGKTYLAGVTVNAADGRGVFVAAAAATVEQSAGTISGATNNNVYMTAGTYTLSGGTITEGSVYVSGTASFAISGAPKVELLNLAEGRKLTLNDLVTGAEINVVAPDGVFSTTHASATDYTAFVKAATAGKQVTAVDNALVMGNA